MVDIVPPSSVRANKMTTFIGAPYNNAVIPQINAACCAVFLDDLSTSECLIRLESIVSIDSVEINETIYLMANTLVELLVI